MWRKLRAPANLILSMTASSDLHTFFLDAPSATFVMDEPPRGVKPCTISGFQVARK